MLTFIANRFLMRVPRQFNKNNLFNKWSLGIWISTCKKTEVGPLTPDRNELQMDHGPKCKSLNYKTLRKNHKSQSLLPWVTQPKILRSNTNSTNNERKNRLTGRHQNEKHLCFQNTINKVERQPTDRRKHHISDKGSVSRINNYIQQ